MEADVHIALRDGSTARVRPVLPADAPALRDFLRGLSENSRWLRFFSLGVDLDRAAERAAAGDRPDGYGLIVTTGAQERVPRRDGPPGRGEARGGPRRVRARDARPRRGGVRGGRRDAGPRIGHVA